MCVDDCGRGREKEKREFNCRAWHVLACYVNVLLSLQKIIELRIYESKRKIFSRTHAN